MADPHTPQSRHRNVNPEALLPPVGFSHATVASAGRTVHLGGQTGHRADGGIDDDLVGQFVQALRNLVVVLEACDAHPDDLVSVVIYTTDVAAYRHAARDLGDAWRTHIGRHYPAMALLGVSELYDPRALVEVVATAVIPEGYPGFG
jgi:enamine deaminase RidA (YjgF/YER057c/UK114 family)